MKSKNVPDLVLLKTLTKRKWGPKRDRVVRFLVRDDDAFEQISPLVRDAEWIGTFSYLVVLYDEASAIRAANAAARAVEEMLNGPV